MSGNAGDTMATKGLLFNCQAQFLQAGLCHQLHCGQFSAKGFRLKAEILFCVQVLS
jgi:hypothetical protein